MKFLRKGKNSRDGLGLILFDRVEAAIRGENVLQAAGYDVKMVAPPPELRAGCDLALEISIVERAGIERILEEKGADYLDIVPLKGEGDLLAVVQVTDFDEAVMVKAGNMKLTFDKKTGIILNVSGGGCPDIPSLHIDLLDRTLAEAPRPKDKGFTLCSLMLDVAFVKSLDIWKGTA